MPPVSHRLLRFPERLAARSEVLPRVCKRLRRLFLSGLRRLHALSRLAQVALRRMIINELRSRVAQRLHLPGHLMHHLMRSSRRERRAHQAGAGDGEEQRAAPHQSGACLPDAAGAAARPRETVDAVPFLCAHFLRAYFLRAALPHPPPRQHTLRRPVKNRLRTINIIIDAPRKL